LIVTTAGLTRSTRSAKLKGALFSSMRAVRQLLADMVVPRLNGRTGGKSAKAPGTTKWRRCPATTGGQRGLGKT
jgi:hypothetical protein